MVGTWSVSAQTVCTATPLTDKDANNVLNVAAATQTVTVTNFSEIASGSSITISCNYLTTTATAGSAAFVNSLKTYDAADDEIEKWNDPTPSKTVTVTAPSPAVAAGVSSEWAHTITPSNSGESGSNGHLKFKVSQTLPKGTLIKITYPDKLTAGLSAGDVKNYCWSMNLYTGCSISGNAIDLTIGADISSGTFIELFLEGGFNVASDTTTSTTGFNVLATWGTLEVIKDLTTGVSAAKKFTAAAALTGTLSEETLTMSNKNAGEYADYTFSFKASVGYSVGDMIEITFPREYDPFVGYASAWFSSGTYAGKYYLNCESTAMGLSWCEVDKRCVTVTGTSQVEATSAIDIKLKMVANAASGNQATQFKVAIKGSDGAYKVNDTTFGGAVQATVAAPASNILFKSVMASSHMLFAHGIDYTFKFFLAGTSLDTDEKVSVKFPHQYELYLADGVDKYTCETSNIDTALATATSNNWNTDTDCATNKTNMVELDAVTSAVTYTSATEFTYIVKGVGNPEYGMNRVSSASSTWDFDDVDFTLFTDYDSWTEKFELFTYDASDNAYKSKSYGNLNAAYLGFNYQYDQMTVNGYNPMTMANRITVWAGSYSTDTVIAVTSASG